MEQLLRWATWSAAALLAAGLVMAVAGIPAAETLLHAGLWTLIATPIVRVLLALAGYLRERDWVFTGVTLVVLVSVVFALVRFLVLLPG